MTTRLNKALSAVSGCSRRSADSYIKEGLVFVNGRLIDNPGTQILDSDVISFKSSDYTLSQLVKTNKLWIYHKPKGLVTTHKDEKDRNTVFSDVSKKINERVISIGRLDLNSEGLLLLTNNGDFSRFAESPKTGWKRVYKVRIFGNITQNTIDDMQKGVVIDEMRYAPMKVKIMKKPSGNSLNSWVECVLTEGKNREIRKIFNHFGIMVNKLIRVQYGDYKLGNLAPGEIIQVDFPKNCGKWK